MIVIQTIARYFCDYNVSLFLFGLSFLSPYPLRKNRIWLLLTCGAVFLFLPNIFRWATQTSFYSGPWFMIGWYSISYVLLLGCLFLLYYFTFRISAKELMLILGCSYLLQNIVYNFYVILSQALPDLDSFVYNMANLIVTLGTAAGIFVSAQKQVIKFDVEKIKSRVIFGLVIAVILLLTVISQRFDYDDPENVLQIGISLYAEISSILLLIILIVIFSNSWLIHENDVMNELFKKSEKQYQISRDNVEYINEKVHDLKHQVAALKQLMMQNNCSPEIREKYADLEKVIQVYNNTVLTGNGVLNALLTEEELLCRKNNVQFDFSINGETLDFIEPVDLYILFGNALNNAIESVIKIEDVSKRVISIHVSRKGKLIHIEFLNPYTGHLIIRNGMPCTSKQGKNYHGFGIKSILHIAKKYGGNAAFSAEDGQFRLAILLPVK